MNKTWAVIPLLLSWAPTAASGAPNESRQTQVHPFPQIIQAHDYPTIEAIETLVDDLERVGTDTVSCSAAQSILSRRSYTAESTVTLFSTLERLLADLSKTRPCAAVGFSRFSTRAYKTRSVVEFDFGPTVLVIDASSNGPDDNERLYVLDTLERNESWGHVP